MTAATTGTLTVDELLLGLREIPSAARTFVLTADEASRRYRVHPRHLDLLSGYGLCEERDGIAYFDHNDMINIEFYAGGGPITASLRRFWPAMLDRAPDPGPVTYHVEYDAACPDPDHPAECEFSLLLPDGRHTVHCPPSRHGTPLATVDIEIPTRWPALPDAARGLIDTVADVRFVRLPRKRGYDWDDIEFMRRTGLGDCGTVANVLVRRAPDHGVTMRTAYGLMLAPPFSLMHCWAEALVDGVWVPVDPLLLNALIGWNVLDAGRWPPYRSPGATLFRLDTDYQVLGRHHGANVPVIFRATVIPNRDRCRPL